MTTLFDKLLPYQKELVKCKPNEKVIIRKSRRTGYTWAQSLRMILDIINGDPWNIISYRMDSSKLVIEDCIYWVQEICDSGLSKAGDWECIKESVTYLPNKTSIRALPCVAKVIRGKKGHVLIDEAAHIPILGEILDAVRPLSIWGYGITLISSPYREGLFEELCRSDKWQVKSIDIYEAVDQGLYHKIRESMNLPAPTKDECDEWIEGLIDEAGKSACHEYLCETVKDSKGDWFSDATQSVDIPVVFPESDRADRFRVLQLHSIGVDVGVVDAPTVITICTSSGLHSILELRNKTIPDIARFLSTLITTNTQKVAIDTNGLGRGLADILAEEFKSKIVYCPNTSQWINTHVVMWLNEVWQGTAQISSDPIVMNDLANVEMINGKLVFRSTIMNGVSRHCDSVPSMVMAHQHKPSSKSMYLD